LKLTAPKADKLLFSPFNLSPQYYSPDYYSLVMSPKATSLKNKKESKDS
jgi:hypothetical protein